MTTLILKDLSRLDELDRTALLSVHGGIACVTREAPVACPGGMMPPVFGRRGWNECPPIHSGCGPVWTPLEKLHPLPGHVVPF